MAPGCEPMSLYWVKHCGNEFMPYPGLKIDLNQKSESEEDKQKTWLPLVRDGFKFFTQNNQNVPSGIKRFDLNPNVKDFSLKFYLKFDENVKKKFI